jgi:hypothetical protein
VHTWKAWRRTFSSHSLQVVALRKQQACEMQHTNPGTWWLSEAAVKFIVVS